MERQLDYDVVPADMLRENTASIEAVSYTHLSEAGGMVSAFPFGGGNTGGSRYPSSRRLSGNPGDDLAYRGQAGRQLYHVLYPRAVI